MPLTYTCDIIFDLAATVITMSSGPAIADGQVVVSADSSGAIRYFISSSHSPSDPPYSSRSNTTGVFTGLLPGSYVVNARTNDTCKQEITIVIDYSTTWAPRWRIQNGTRHPNSGLQFRVDIEDNTYVGAVSYVTAASQPYILEHTNDNADNVFSPVIGSKLSISLISPSEGYFDTINGFSEKRFRATFYEYVSGSYVQKWQGFVVPQNSDEEYCLTSNYVVSFEFSDGLADLINAPFTDDSGNNLKGRISILQGIIFCLNKTSLQLDIWETVNLFEDAMLFGTNDSTLTQCYFDPEVYLKADGTMEDCLTVLKSLLTNFAARLTQSDGHWSIDCPTLNTATNTHTRKFDHKGTFLLGDSTSYRIMLRRGNAVNPKVSFENYSALKSHQTMYSTLNFTFDYGLKTNPSVIEGGDFENEDLTNGQLTDWQITQEQDVAVNPTLEKVSRDKNTVSQVLQINFDNFFSVASYSGNEPRAIIASKPINFDFTGVPAGTRMRFSFDVFANQYSQQPYIFFDWTIYCSSSVFGDIYLKFDGARASDNYTFIASTFDPNVEGKYIRIYLDPGKWTTITADFDPNFAPSGLGVAVFQVIFRVNGNLQYDYASIAALQAVTTRGSSDDEANLRAGRNNRRRVFDNLYSGGINTVRQYTLVAGADTPDSYNVVLPGDQVGHNEYFWKLDKVLVPDANLWARNVQIDNVVLKYLPSGNDPVSKEDSSIVLNSKIKNSFDVTFRHGDLPDDVNYKNIMRGYLSLADGTPTQSWEYKPVPPSSRPKSLIELLKSNYNGQYKTDRWRLSGSLLSLEVMPYINFPIYEVRTGKIYCMVNSAIDAMEPANQMVMIEVISGAPVIDEGTSPDPAVEPPVSTADFSSTDFSSTDFITA